MLQCSFGELFFDVFDIFLRFFCVCFISEICAMWLIIFAHLCLRILAAEIAVEDKPAKDYTQHTFGEDDI